MSQHGGVAWRLLYLVPALLVARSHDCGPGHIHVIYHQAEGLPVQSNDHHKFFFLSDADKLRLERFAPLFDIEIKRLDEDIYGLKSVSSFAPLDTTLYADVVHTRLLVEICSRAVNWIFFHFGKSCKESLLELSDARIQRVAELYALERDKYLCARRLDSGDVKR
jgi:hypothetical protein